FAGKKSAQIREILISESAWEEMTCLFAPSLTYPGFRKIPTECNVFYYSVFHATFSIGNGMDTAEVQYCGMWRFAFLTKAG
ncbi:TPA: hypothetical protein ACPXR2_005732, partial [Klebsiella pneumoniae]